MSVVAKLRKLLEQEHNQVYPPSEDLWKTILQITLKPKKEEDPEKQLRSLQARAKHDEDLYKPNLPEPLLTSFYHQRKLYYLDTHLQVYQTDLGNPLVGNLVGHFQPNPKNKTNLDLIFHDNPTQIEYTIDTNKVKEKHIYNKTYYQDLEHNLYRGFHPNLNLIYQVGELTDEGKIKLT